MAGGTLDKTLEDLTQQDSGRTIVLVDSSRSDLLLGLSAAHGSRTGPHLAGALIANGQEIPEQVEQIVKVCLA